jgi:hypothetical protein
MQYDHYILTIESDMGEGETLSQWGRRTPPRCDTLLKRLIRRAITSIHNTFPGGNFA